MNDRPASADEIIALLHMQPHPEGGFFRETFRDSRTVEGRAVSTAALYLLRAGDVSAWHRIDAAEIWHWHAGSALDLSISHDGELVETLRLGPDIAMGDLPQGIVPAGAWQSAVGTGAWTLVGVTVSPGFEFAHFELAPPGWSPGKK